MGFAKYMEDNCEIRETYVYYRGWKHAGFPAYAVPAKDPEYRIREERREHEKRHG